MSKYRRPSNHKERWLNVTRLMARDGTSCAICGEPLDRGLKDCTHPRYITFDHVVPRSHGGLTRLDNLRLAHQLCNNRRGNDPLDELTLAT